MFETCRDTQSGHNFQFGLFPSVFTLSAVFFCLEEIMMEEGKEWCGEHIMRNGFNAILRVSLVILRILEWGVSSVPLRVGFH